MIGALCVTRKLANFPYKQKIWSETISDQIQFLYPLEAALTIKLSVEAVIQIIILPEKPPIVMIDVMESAAQN